MPHSPADKKRAITRLRRIRGQAEALERVVAGGASCGDVLQQLAAMRGAVNGLMADVLEGHLRETFGVADAASAAAPSSRTSARSLPPPSSAELALDEASRLIRSYLK